MSHFIGNDSVTFDIEKIVFVYWNCCGENKDTRVEILFNDGSDLYLYYESDEDFKLINDLRNEFGQEPLLRVR